MKTKRRVLIRRRLRNLFSAFSLIPVVLFCSLLTGYVTYSELTVRRSTLTTALEYRTDRMNQRLLEAYQIGKSASEDDAIVNSLKQEPQSEQARFSDEITMDNELSYISRYFDKQIQLYVIAENGSLYKSGRYSFARENYRDDDWYRATISAADVRWFPFYEQSLVVRSVRQSYVALGIPICESDTGRVLGAVLVEVRMDDILSDALNFSDHFYVIGPHREMDIVDEHVEQYENDVVMTFDDAAIATLSRTDEKPTYVQRTINLITYWRKSFPDKGFLQASGYAVAYDTLSANGWILVSVIPFQLLYQTSFILVGTMIIGLIALSFLALYASNAVARTVTHPILLLNQSMHMVRGDNFDITVERTSDDEIGDLAIQFEKMLHHIRRLMARIIEEQSARQKYELLLLQAQINPHFLYNALDSIAWLIRMNRNDDAGTMLAALTTFFKTGLNKGQETVLLSQEVANVQSYMTIQTFRYKTKLSYSVTLDPEVSDVEIPKLVLQPLVENSIYHGIKEKEGPGHVSLECGREGGRVRICVSDDGIGISEENLEHLRAAIASTDIQNRDSYGIINVYERLRLFFHNDCTLTIHSVPGQGATVVILLGREGNEHV